MTLGETFAIESMVTGGVFRVVASSIEGIGDMEKLGEQACWVPDHVREYLKGLGFHLPLESMVPTCDDPEKLLALTWAALVDAVKPKVSYEVDVAALDGGECGLGDDVLVGAVVLDPASRATARTGTRCISSTICWAASGSRRRGRTCPWGDRARMPS